MKNDESIFTLLRENTITLLDQILPRDKKGGYCCPVCGNGTGKDGDGLYTRDGVIFRCYRCNFWGDVIEIIKARYSINTAQALEKGKEMLSLVNYTEKPRNSLKSPYKAKYSYSYDKAIDDIINGQKEYNQKNADLIEIAKRDARGLLYGQKRGIPIEISKHFQIGYLEYWRGNKGEYVIIPTSKDSFTIRNIDPNCSKSERYRKWNGKQRIDIPFGILQIKPDTPVVITEGAYDALSLIAIGYQAVAINGSSIDTTVEFLHRLIDAPVIVMTDNDGAGRRKAKELIEKLKTYNFHGIDVGTKFYNGYSDPNDLLINEKEHLKKKMRAVFSKF